QWSQYKEYDRTPKPFPSDSAAVVASALTSITNFPAYLSGGIISSHHQHVDKNVPFGVSIETLTGVKWLIENLTGKTTVQELKERIQEIGYIPDTISHRLIFNGRHLLNSKRLGDYDISHLFESPCDWKRIPLTPSSTEKHSIYKIWPYSYHATSTRKSKTIADAGLIHSKRHKFNFGHGIYTTPDINLASLYSHTFIYNGSKYLILLQNRVNTKTLVRISLRKGGDEYCVSRSEDDLKPYDLFIKKIGYCK
ncbi:113_t:CDS:2, partial [Funneliformis geosporum]